MPVNPLLPLSPPVFAAGFPYQAADFNNLIQQPLSFCSLKNLFRARQTTLQAIGTSATTLNAWTVDYDPQSGWSAANNWWVVPFTGWYEVSFQLATAVANTLITAGVSLTGTLLQGNRTNGGAALAAGAAADVLVYGVATEDTIAAQALGAVGFNTDVAAHHYSSLEISYWST